jgi:hypothetical protein
VNRRMKDHGTHLGLVDISEPTDGIVLQKSARKFFVCSTGDIENRKVFCNLLICVMNMN